MARLTGVNTFEGGMVKDIHPIMVPKNVLTDCLNGTLITYNGNEFALQNDMGNYAFKEGNLNNGFVPIGIKEHGGVLYIVSYNPTNNRVEIGSFPSQKTIFNSNDSNVSTELSPIKLEEKKKYFLYTTLSAGYKLCLFSKEDTFFLNPGDKYILELQSDKGYEDLNSQLAGLNKWQHLTPYILTNENKLFNIQGHLTITPEGSTHNREDYKQVKWDIPGWLAAQFTVNVMDEFTAYYDNSGTKFISEDEVSEDEVSKNKVYYVVPSGTLKLQTFWNSNVYDSDIIDSIKDNLVYIFHNESELSDKFNAEKSLIIEKLNELLDYNSEQFIIYYNDTKGESAEYNYVVPALRVGNQYIIYNQFNTSIAQEKQKIETDKIKFAENIFKYYVDSNSITLSFDYFSYPGLNLEYRLRRYVDPCQTSGTVDSEWNSLQNVYSDNDGYKEIDTNYNGQNVFDIPFTTKSDYIAKKYSEDQGEYLKYSLEGNGSFTDLNVGTINKSFGEKSSISVANTFDKEDFYKIDFRITSGSDLNLNDKTWTFDLYATELVNRFYYLEDNYNRENSNEEKAVNLRNLTDDLDDRVNLAISCNLNEYKTVVKVDNQKWTGSETESAQNKFITEIEGANNGTFNESGISNILGSEFVAFDGVKDKFAITKIVSSGIEYTLFDTDQDYYKVSYPKNQYGATGRIWRNLETTIGKKVLLDKRGNVYDVKDGNLFISDNYSLFLNSYLKHYNKVTAYKRLSEISTSRTDVKVTVEKDPTNNEKNKYISVKGGIDLSRNKNASDGFQVQYFKSSSSPTYYYKFDEIGDLFYTTSQPNDSTSWMRVTSTLGYPSYENYAAQATSYLVTDDGTGRENIPHTIRRAPFDINSLVKGPQIYRLRSRRSQNWGRIKSEQFDGLVSTRGGDESVWFGIFMNGKSNPVILYPNGVEINPIDTKEAVSKSFRYAFFMFITMHWYIRFASSVISENLWFPSIPNPKATLFQDTVATTLNSEYTFTSAEYPLYDDKDNIEWEDFYNILKREVFLSRNNVNIPLKLDNVNEGIYSTLQELSLWISGHTIPEDGNSGIKNKCFYLIDKDNCLLKSDLEELCNSMESTGERITLNDSNMFNYCQIRNGDDAYSAVAKESSLLFNLSSSTQWT